MSVYRYLSMNVNNVHRFQHPGHEDEGAGEAKFVMIWQFKGGNWKLSRVISYDHAVAKP